MENKPLAPTAIASLVLGILSISLCRLVIPGIILANIGLKKTKEGYKAIMENPDLYSGEPILKAGRITSIIGLICSIGFILYWVFYILYIIVLIDSY